MARITEDIDSLQQEFQRRTPSYMATDINVTAYEEASVGAGNPQPAGWVENSVSTVSIDEEGLHVSDGAIFISDYSGDSVLGAAGFDGSWVDFIQTGVFNGFFNGGVDSSGLTAVTQVNDGYGADYVSSLSADIPYWVIQDVTGSATYGLATDATYGRVLKVVKSAAAASTMTFYQDVPIRGSQAVEMQVSVVFDRGEVTADKIDFFYSALDGDHQVIAPYEDVPATGLGIDVSALAAGVTVRAPHSILFSLPDQARYIRWKMTVTLAATAAIHDTTAYFLSSRSLPRIPALGYYFPYVSTSDPTETAYDVIRNGDSGIEMGFNSPMRGLQLNTLSAGLGGGTDDTAFEILQGSDDQPFFVISVDGQMFWGAGGASSVDTKLYRSAADTLETPDTFKAAGFVVPASGGGQALSVNDGYILFDTISGAAPANPAIGRVKLYARLNSGTGKTELRARFDSGSEVSIISEP